MSVAMRGHDERADDRVLDPAAGLEHGAGFFVKKSTLIAGRPLRATETITIPRTTIASTRGGGARALHQPPDAPCAGATAADTTISGLTSALIDRPIRRRMRRTISCADRLATRLITSRIVAR